MVKLLQCLCGPRRHCILALAVRDIDDAEILGAFRQAVPLLTKDTAAAADLRKEFGLSGPLHPWCALCGANQAAWIYEIAPTQEQDWDRAIADLRAHEMQQHISRELLKAAGLAYDAVKN